MQWFRRHAAVYFLAMAGYAGLALLADAVVWQTWPALFWGFLLILHYLAAKTLNVNQAWADRRATRLRLKSYDVGHIEAIEEEHGVGPPRRRKRR